MIWIGNKGRDIYSTWDLSEDDKKKPEVYYQNFEKHVHPKSNKIYSRYKFLSRVQKDIDTFEEYLTDLKILVKDCGYSMVTVIKPNGKIRICIDPRDLNKAILREYYPLKTVEEVISQMPNAKVFSKLDATSGFWHIQLGEPSSKLCTFNTPFGRYRFARLPFGINSASEVFQKIVSEMVSDIEGAEAIIDDILIWTWSCTDTKPVAYASRALTQTQQRYPQIEKETLAIVYGCNKFHKYVYGRQVQIETDHKPLQSIFLKPLHQTPPRLQKQLIALEKYDLKVDYKPGKEMYLADHLSRSFLKETKEVLVPDLHVNDITHANCTRNVC
ncbi:unnamed protein product [Mytilus coruscus]|uniref:Reverse transcriptase domain-containing protein n=1 Tax=Mytilus coruscus TaxID=42192 RepID=A0A6J8BCK9_MYTCO|nr:unnamed protein product [Mytilus coruscus]